MCSLTDLLQDIADVADELTNPQRHTERVPMPDGHGHIRATRRAWTVTLPSLLDQLASAVVPGEAYTEDEPSARGSFGSRPAARLDAVDRLLAIEAGAAMWVRDGGMTLRDEPARNVRAMVGFAPILGSTFQARMLADLRAWRTWAATVTGWERPPDAPRAACLNCGKINTLRVRLDRETACCMDCGAWWDRTTIGILAAHITATADRTGLDTKALRRAAVLARREHDRSRRALAGQDRPDLPYACRECGKPRCQEHAAQTAAP